MGIPENIDALLVKFDLKPESLARIAGVSTATVSRWRTGQTDNIRKANLDRICEQLELTPDDILSSSAGLAAKEHGRCCPPANAIPVKASAATVPLLTLGRVYAGALADEEEAAHGVEVPASVCEGHPRAFALQVEGDCMNRVVPEGAHVLVDPDLEPGNGSIAVVEAEGYRAVMRRWYRGSSNLMLCADSFSEHDDMVFGPDDGPVRVVGTVVWFQAAEEMG